MRKNPLSNKAKKLILTDSLVSEGGVKYLIKKDANVIFFGINKVKWRIKNIFHLKQTLRLYITHITIKNYEPLKNNYIFFSTGKYQHIIINSPSSEDDLCLGEK